MDSERFKHLQALIGYDDARMAGMLNISVADVVDYASGKKPVPLNKAEELELFVDWASEVGDTTVKKELAKKYLGG